VVGFQTVRYELSGGAWGTSGHMLQWNYEPTMLEGPSQDRALCGRFRHTTNGNQYENQVLPPSSWTPGHRLTMIIATPDSVMTYDETIRCPSIWTPDHRMNALSPIFGISYDQSSGVQTWTNGVKLHDVQPITRPPGILYNVIFLRPRIGLDG
jgi:hypothetical protein